MSFRLSPLGLGFSVSSVHSFFTLWFYIISHQPVSATKKYDLTQILRLEDFTTVFIFHPDQG